MTSKTKHPIPENQGPVLSRRGFLSRSGKIVAVGTLTNFTLLGSAKASSGAQPNDMTCAKDHYALCNPYRPCQGEENFVCKDVFSVCTADITPPPNPPPCDTQGNCTNSARGAQSCSGIFSFFNSPPPPECTTGVIPPSGCDWLTQLFGSDKPE